MAKLLRPTGGGSVVVEDVTPANGRTFVLAELQGFVGGYIEALRPDADHWMFINEDGKRLALPYNDLATQMLRGLIRGDDYIVGTAVLCDSREAGADESELDE